MGMAFMPSPEQALEASCVRVCRCLLCLSVTMKLQPYSQEICIDHSTVQCDVPCGKWTLAEAYVLLKCSLVCCQLIALMSLES